MNDSIYIFKQLQNDVYLDCENDLIEFSFKEFSIFNSADFNYPFTYSSYKIPKGTLSLIEELLTYKKFDLIKYKNEFVYLLVYCQAMFLEIREIYSDEVILDFQDEDNDYENLFNILEEYLFSTKKPHSISFKFNEETSIVNTIKNKDVVNDVFKSICYNLQINKENFFQVKETKLKESSHIKYGKGGEYIKQIIVNVLVEFLKLHLDKKTSDSTIFRFCGCFLHLCQIPYNSVEKEILLSSIENEFKTIEPQYISHIYNKRKIVFSQK